LRYESRGNYQRVAILSDIAFWLVVAIVLYWVFTHFSSPADALDRLMDVALQVGQAARRFWQIIGIPIVDSVKHIPWPK